MKNIISVSLSGREVQQLEKLARREKTSRSDIIREALMQYERQQQWDKILVWGRKTALEMGIASYEDVDRIAGK